MNMNDVATAVAFLEDHCSFWKIERSNGIISTERLDITVRTTTDHTDFNYGVVRARQGESVYAAARRAVAKSGKRSAKESSW